MKYLFTLLILIMFSLLFQGVAVASEETITLPISENGYLKERWSVDYIRRKGYLAVGSDNSVYKEGRMRTYLFYNLDELIDKEITTDQIETANLILTFYRADRYSPSTLPIHVTHVDHDPERLRNPWPALPLESESLSTNIIDKKAGEKSLDVTSILKDHLDMKAEKPGILLYTPDESQLAYYFYSRECIGNELYYSPQCTPEMRPRVEVKIIQNNLIPAVIEDGTIFRSDIGLQLLTWEGESEQLYQVEIANDPNFENLIHTSDWTDKLHYTYDTSIFGEFFWRVIGKIDDRSNETTSSNRGKIIIFDTENFSPTVVNDGAELKLTNLPYEELLTPVWEISNEPTFTKAKTVEGMTINLDELCEENLSLNHVRARIKDPNGQHTKYSQIVIYHCNRQIPTFIDERLAYIFNLKNEQSVKGAKDTIEDKEQAKEENTDLAPILCVSKYHLPFFRREIDCERIGVKILEVENIKLDDNQYWIKVLIQLPEKIEMIKNTPLCIFKGFYEHECDYSTGLYIESHFVFQHALGIAKSEPYITEKQSGRYLFLYSSGKDLSGEKLRITSKLAIPSLEGFHSSENLDLTIPIATKPEYLKKEFMFPFSTPVGVTQWHGYTAFASPHTGIDFGVKSIPVRAIGDGEVKIAQYDNYNGKCLSGGYYMIIQHPSGKHSAYMHLQQGSLKKAPGESVFGGEVIATSGNSGSFNCQPLGHHLHLETRTTSRQSSHTDPVKLIEYDWELISTKNPERYPDRLTGDNPHPGR